MIIVRKMNFFVKKYVKIIDLRRITIVKNMFFGESIKITKGILLGYESLKIDQ